MHQMDVKTTFLHGEIDEEIYMQPPPGSEYEQGQVCRLRKAIYGLKQASRSWYLRLHQMLTNEGFRCNKVEASVYICNKNEVILAVYVDDIILISPSMEGMEKTKAILEKHFAMTDGGNLSYCIGLEFKYDQGKRERTVGQGHYVDYMMKKFRMKNAATVTTPMELGDTSGPGKELAPEVPYRSLIGSLMYAGICTRPDICMAVGRISRHFEKPSIAHWNVAKRVLRYLKRTREVGLKYVGNSIAIECFVDADWAGDVATRKSTTGMVITMGGAAVLWNSLRQSCVALSVAEAEYMALAHGVKESLWITSFMREAGLEMVTDKIPMWSDNQGVIAMAGQSGRTIHLIDPFRFRGGHASMFPYRQWLEAKHLRGVLGAHINAISSYSEKNIDEKQFQDFMVEKMIPMLPTIPTIRQLNERNYSTWVAQMEVVLDLYDCLVMLNETVDHIKVFLQATRASKAKETPDCNH
ncbi:hypothetical protein L7F22_033546 [Adiantum nelumboides]|nr:hypothetical protein [Adiantum nelumboides]